ncbi:aspartic peptidase domain-containing protein [Mycena leptocephala]|nr:aspartic peptidase domain-containing protein [Mycena leptocephala]
MRYSPFSWRAVFLGSIVTQSERLPVQPRDQNIASLQSANITLSSLNGTLGSAVNGSIYRYVSNITVNGQDFRVAIDTGSSDFWLVPPKDFEFNNTGISVGNSYGGGEVTGTIGFASVTLGGYTVDNQAFSNATSVGLKGVLDVGLDGFFGLAFGGRNPSDITNQLYSKGPTLGQPFLYNVFDQNPDQDNFIGISLSRSDDLEDSADASFAINEIDAAYAAVTDAPTLPPFPGTNGRWSILIDGISVDGVDIPLPNSTAGAPPGQLVALMDTGAPGGKLPESLWDAMYSQIPGSDGSYDYIYVLPCNTTSIVSIKIGGQDFPIHPLDLSTIEFLEYSDIGNCYSSFDQGDPDYEMDMILGTSFLRNFYSVFNFGNAISHSPTGNASMQLLSQTNATAVVADVFNVRAAQTAVRPHWTGFPAAAALADADPGSNSDSESQVAKYAPIAIGLLGANLFVVLILALGGLVLCVKGCGQSVSRTRASKYASVRVSDEVRPLDSYEDKRYSD